MKTIKFTEYENACNNYMGWCVMCQSFTRPNTEPDAKEYYCPKCKDSHSVFGVEEALLNRYFEVE